MSRVPCPLSSFFLSRLSSLAVLVSLSLYVFISQRQLCGRQVHLPPRAWSVQQHTRHSGRCVGPDRGETRHRGRGGVENRAAWKDEWVGAPGWRHIHPKLFRKLCWGGLLVHRTVCEGRKASGAARRGGAGRVWGQHSAMAVNWDWGWYKRRMSRGRTWHLSGRGPWQRRAAAHCPRARQSGGLQCCTQVVSRHGVNAASR